jgi:hypothetical protein
MLDMPELQVRLHDAFLQYAAISVRDLWVGCFGLGANYSELQLEAFLYGALRPTSDEYNLMADVLNEHFMDIESNHLVRYIEN